jgi:hypothetical protein
MSLNNSVECVTPLPSTPPVSSVKYVKDNNGNYVCPHTGCGKTTVNQNTMHYHIMDHSENLPFQ